MSLPLSAPPDVEILRCAACGQLDPGPRELCPSCYSPRMETVAVAGRGTLVSWTHVRRPPSRFQADGPYAVAVVDLDCGVRLTGRLAEVPRDEADAPPLGASMRLSGVMAGAPLFTCEADGR